MKPGKFDSVICCSGDGLFHEVLNAAMNRADRDGFLAQTTFSILPAGTSNGFAKSIVDEAGEQFSVLTCAFLICKNRSKSIDIAELTGEKQGKIYSFMSMAWGLVADVDLHSEVIRFVGNARIWIYAIYKILKGAVYQGKIEY